jgi:hypothetical protein
MRVYRLLVVAVLLVSGCTWTSVRDRDPRPPESPKQVLILGRVDMSKNPYHAEWTASWWQHQPAFEKGFRDWIARNRSDWTVVSDERHGQPPVPAPPGSVILTGTITSLSYGIGALRFLPGMGAGQEKVAGDFELHAADGRLLARFHARESYLGGFAIGGPDMISMDTVIRRFAKATAKKVVNTVAPKQTAEAR